jgi:hypothetical protein
VEGRTTQSNADWDSTIWCLQGDVLHFYLARSREDELERFIKHSNKILQPHKRFLPHISSTGGSIEYFVVMYLDKNHGVLLSPELLDELAKLQIALSLDLLWRVRSEENKTAKEKVIRAV